jgi:hypothetical protein
MKIAIYEPDPRICGPGTWAQNLRRGFLMLGHECDLVAFNNSGKRSPRWGRVERSKGSTMSSTLDPTRVDKLANAGAVLDEYDLVVLTDLKTPPADNAALTNPMLDEPTYVTALRATRTRWTSAMHERWYYARPHDAVPPGLSEWSGAPFLYSLLDLPNFSGFLMAHSADFDKYSERLRGVRKTLMPLPYLLSATDEQAAQERPAETTMATIGRMIPTKHRHVICEMLTRGVLKHTTALFGGTCCCTHGPSETYMIQERLVERGWTSDWGDDGVRKTKPFRAELPGHDNVIQYLGAYQTPWEVLQHAHVHVGITDCDFSGGLLEFATLEAIDHGCVPVITQPFVPHCGTGAVVGVIPHGFHKFTVKSATEASDSFYEAIAGVVDVAMTLRTLERVRHNRDCVARENDPTRHAALYLENCL